MDEVKKKLISKFKNSLGHLISKYYEAIHHAQQ